MSLDAKKLTIPIIKENCSLSSRPIARETKHHLFTERKYPTPTLGEASVPLSSAESPLTKRNPDACQPDHDIALLEYVHSTGKGCRVICLATTIYTYSITTFTCTTHCQRAIFQRQP